VSGNPVLPAGQQIMWNAATMQQQPVNAAISSPMISPVAPPTVNMADLVAMPTNVNIQNLAQIQQRPISHLPQVVVIKTQTPDITQFFEGRMLLLTPNQHCRSTIVIKWMKVL